MLDTAIGWQTTIRRQVFEHIRIICVRFFLGKMIWRTPNAELYTLAVNDKNGCFHVALFPTILPISSSSLSKYDFLCVFFSVFSCLSHVHLMVHRWTTISEWKYIIGLVCKKLYFTFTVFVFFWLILNFGYLNFDKNAKCIIL